MESTLHLFDIKKEQEERAAVELDTHYISRGVEVRTASLAEDIGGKDRWFAYDGMRYSVQYKMDFEAARTDRAFIELVHTGNYHAIGWAYKCQADWLLIYVQGPRRAYWFKPEYIRDRVGFSGNSWVWEYRQNIRPARNVDYWTLGICVPIDVIEESASSVDFIDQAKNIG